MMLLLASCASYTPEARHEAFKTMYGDRQVGISRNDLVHSWLARYPDNILSEKKLPNGNIEIEYRPVSYRSGCKVFYEVDSKSDIVVRWWYEGGVKECRWNP